MDFRVLRRLVTRVAAAFPDVEDLPAGFLGEIFFSAIPNSPPLLFRAP